jgi:hypothetical protein
VVVDEEDDEEDGILAPNDEYFVPVEDGISIGGRAYVETQNRCYEEQAP